MPLVSVIVPARNAESTIADTLRSLLSQTIRDIEVIVIDDCSDDATLSVISSYTDRRLRVLTNDKRVGPATCRNLGVQAASGEYLAFVDADDVVEESYIETIVLHLSELGPRAILATDIWICTSSSGRGLIPVYTMFSHRGLRVSPGAIRQVKLAELINCKVDIKPAIRTRELLDSNVRFWDGALGEEWLPFLVGLELAGFSFFVLGIPLYYYRVHAANVSRRYETIVREMHAVDRLLEAPQVNECTARALRHYRAFLYGRAPWVALRSGLLREFVRGLVEYPSALVFPVFKLRSWLRQWHITTRS